jgi:hypothetical protein
VSYAPLQIIEKDSRGERIRTSDPLLQNQMTCSFHVVSAVAHRGILEEKQDDFLMENHLGVPPLFLGGDDSYKIDYSAVAVKSRCVTKLADIALIINGLCWSGRRDSNPRPSAPKADALPGCATPRRLY